MMSTVLRSESLLSHANNNPLLSFNGGFTPWEIFESFFTSNEHKPSPTLENNHDALIEPTSNPNLSHYHASMNLGSVVNSNLTSYHADNPISNLGLEGLDNHRSNCFNEPNLGRYHASLDLGSECPNLSRHYISSPLGLESSLDQKSLSFDKTSLDDDQPSPNSVLSIFASDFSSDDPNQVHDQPSPNSVLLSSSPSSDDPSQNQNGSNMDSCANTGQAVNNTMDEKKRKRMISNRESARRSRMRKQRHVENLRNNVNQLKIETRERANQLRLMNHHIELVRRENDRLKAESIILQNKLIQLAQIWHLQRQQRSYHAKD